MIFSKNKHLNLVITYALLAGLAVLFALNYHVFVLENDFAPAGLAGLLVMVQYLGGFKISWLNLVINVPLAALCFFFVSRSFAVRSFVFSVVFSGALLLAEYVDFYTFETQYDRILAVISAGFINGFLYGCAIRLGGSTGGTDLLAALIQARWKSYNLVWIIFAINAVVAGASFFVYNNQLEPVLFSLIYSYFTSRVSDNILKGIKAALRAEIVTEDPEPIARALATKLHHGVTEVRALGMYSRKEKFLLVCVINKRELSEFENLIRKFPNVFVSVSSVNQIFGRFYGKQDNRPENFPDNGIPLTYATTGSVVSEPFEDGQEPAETNPEGENAEA
ncbi:MAG: YitT family protein [Firmicutes bacterium]|nr:YitT family protein [Bacillota bacterium]